MAPEERIPLRTCISCRQKRGKTELVRLVRSPDGKVEMDPLAKKPGRGAYICLSAKCWEEGLKAKRLSHALKSTVRQEEIEGLRLSTAGHLVGGS